MNHARINAAAGGLVVAFACLAAAAQLPMAEDLQKVAPKKPAAMKAQANTEEAKKAPAKKAPVKKPEPAKAEAPKQVPRTYSTGPAVLRDKEGNVIPTNPEAYPVDSALPPRKAR